MASYGFSCIECECEFEVAGINLPNVSKESCPDCGSDHLKLIAYDSTEKGSLDFIAREIRAISLKVDDLLNRHFGDDEEEEKENSKVLCHQNN